MERKLWQLPAVGEQIRVYQLARFTRTIAMLLKGGIPLVTALDMTDDLLRQPAFKAGLDQAKRAIREGRGVSDTFGTYGLATEVGTRLLVVGERSGELGDVMQRIADFYDEEIARMVEWFSRLFEPVLMILIGGLIGGIVILMYMPIFELASSIQ
jgi:general secretion pathway protein F